MSIIANVTLKNSNMFSCIYDNTTTVLYYHDIIVGEVQLLVGHVRPRKMVRMNVTVDACTEQIMSYLNLNEDVSSGLLNISSYSRIPGRVKVNKVFKKCINVNKSCTVMFNISSRAIQEQKCKSLYS